MGGWGRGVEGGGAWLLPVGGGGRRELNKDVSRPDRGGETEGAVWGGEWGLESNQGGLISQADEDGDVLLAP